MIDPNKGVSAEILERLRAESEERMCAQVRSAIEMKITDYKMTWDDLAESLDCAHLPIDGVVLRSKIDGGLKLSDLNEIASALSAEVYVILRPRYPFVGT
jgi:hypothetical protein